MLYQSMAERFETSGRCDFNSGEVGELFTGRRRFRRTSFDPIIERLEEDVVVTLDRSLEVVPNAAENRLTRAHEMSFGDAFEIRDLGSHAAATVTTLALLLASTVDVRPDLRRKNFYEVVDGSQVYYIYVSSVSGIIYLLAVWENPVGVRASGPRTSDFLLAGVTTLPHTPAGRFRLV